MTNPISFILCASATAAYLAVLSPTIAQEQKAKARPELVVQTGHHSRMAAIVLSADGKKLVTSNFDNTVRLWDISTGREIRKFATDLAKVAEGVAVSRDGKNVLTIHADGNAYVWNVSDGMRVEAHRAATSRGPVAYFAEGGFLLRMTDGALADAFTGEEIRRLEGMANARDITFSRHGPGVVLAPQGDGNYRLWNLSSGRRLHDLHVSPAGVAATAKAKDDSFMERTLAQAKTDEEKAKLRGRLEALMKVREPVRPTNLRMTAVALSPDGSRSVTASDDGVLRLWNAADGQLVRTLSREAGRGEISSKDPKLATRPEAARARRRAAPGDGDSLDAARVIAVAFSLDGRGVFAASDDGLVRVYDVESGSETRRFSPRVTRDDGRLVAAAFSPDCRWIVLAYGGTLVLVDVETGTEIRRIGEKLTWVRSVAMHPRSSGTEASLLLASVHQDRGVRLWDFATGRELSEIGDLMGQASSVALSRDGRLAIVVGIDGASVADLGTKKEIRRFGERRDPMHHVALSPDGRLALIGHRAFAGSGNPSVKLWDVASGQVVRRFEGHTSQINSVALSQDGRWVLTASGEPGRARDSTARLWDAATGRELHKFAGHEGEVRATFNSDATQVITCGDKTVRFWNTSDGRELQRLQSSRSIECVAISPDGKWLLSGDDSEIRDTTMVRLWNVATRREVWQAPAGGTWVFSVAFSPDGKWMLAGSDDGVVRVWETPRQQQAGTMISCTEVCRFIGAPGATIVATPDNNYIAPRGGLSNVAFALGERVLPFEQFDLKYNRPDLVLQRLGFAPAHLIATYERAFEKRLRRMNFSPQMLGDDFHVPEIAILSEKPVSTRDKRLRVRVKANDTKYPLDRLVLTINGAPLQNSESFSLRDKKIQQVELEIDIELSAGRNTVHVSALNDQGAESLKDTFDVRCDAPAVKPDLHVVVVGISEYKDERYRLTYAHKDAADLAAMFAGQRAQFGEVKVTRLLNQDATRANILKLKEQLAKTKVDDEVVTFFAGHGLLDDKLDYYFATVDVDFKNPSKNGVAYDEIEGLLDGIPARRKLLLMDTCHSGEVDKEEVVKSAQAALPAGVVMPGKARGLAKVDTGPQLGLDNTREILQELFADLRRGTGTVVISAAGGMEFALESRDWKNGVFTYSILDGLRGSKFERKADANKDGQVQVSELRDHVYAEVRRLTQGRQSPTTRRENLAVDFSVN